MGREGLRDHARSCHLRWFSSELTRRRHDVARSPTNYHRARGGSGALCTAERPAPPQAVAKLHRLRRRRRNGRSRDIQGLRIIFSRRLACFADIVGWLVDHWPDGKSRDC